MFKLSSIAALLVALLAVIVFIAFLLPPRGQDKEVNKELDDNLRIASVMERALDSTFQALRLFKQDNGYLPPNDNESAMTALKGKNKTGKDYIAGWKLDYKGRLLDVSDEPIVFRFINDNEITIYSPGTKQQLHGFLDSGKYSVNDSK